MGRDRKIYDVDIGRPRETREEDLQTIERKVAQYPFH